MSDPISSCVNVVAGKFKDLVVDRIVEYVKLIKSYEDNVTELRNELNDICMKKLELDEKVAKGKENLEVMRRQTATWLENVINLMEREEMKMLMKEETVAEIAVKVMDRRALKKLWKEDRELFDIVINAVKNKCTRQEAGYIAILHAEEDADYKKVAKVARDLMTDLAEEFTKFIQSEGAAVEVVKLLDEDALKKLTKERDEMAMILSKAEGVIRKNVEQNDDGDGELVVPKNNEDVGKWRKGMGSLMSFLDDENFKKGLPDSARVGLEVMDTLSKSCEESEQVEPNSKSHRCCGCRVINFKVYRHRHDMSQMAQVMVDVIKSLALKYPSDPVTRAKRDDELEMIPGEFIAGLGSREVILWNILIALKDDQVNIVGVYGMGGSGKTTLAKEVAYKRTRNLFDKGVVVEVSEVPNIKVIQSQIAEGIVLTLDDKDTIAKRAHIVYNQLKSEKRKILIILDNVWKKLKLLEVGIPHKSTKDFWCKLLITTREKRVCTLMDIQEANIFEVGLLNIIEAFNLFEKQAEKTVGSGEFKEVSDRLLRKCGGLPLAITTTASALRGKNLSTWCHFAETSEKPVSSQISSEYRETYSILETSYKLIDNEEKMMFLFLASLSTLDSSIEVDELMRYGIGLDLFQRVNSLSEATEQANTWAKELISSSLLLKGDSNEEVKIHDLVRASTIAFIDKGKACMTLVESIPRWMCKETVTKFTSISLMSGHDFSRLSRLKAPLLEILLLRGDVSSTTLDSDFFQGMKILKVLSLSNVNFDTGLPESIGELERLQTLNLHYCELRDVKLIGKLVNLLVLSLRGSTLENLAIEIGELSNLRLLDIRWCKSLRRIQTDILSRLSNLEGLYMRDSKVVSNQASGSELDTLSHLNVLEMDVFNIEQLLNNGQLIEQLGKFRIRNYHSGVYDDADLSMYRYVLDLRYIRNLNSKLRALLKKTECLILTISFGFTNSVVPELDTDGFKDLKYLELYYCEQLKAIISCTKEENEAMAAFANLEYLEVNMSSLEMICDGKAPPGLFSNLCRLNLRNLQALKHGLPLTTGAFNLSEVSIYNCGNLKSIAYKDAFAAENIESDLDLFTCLKSLDLDRVSCLASVVDRSEITDDVFNLFNAEIEFPCLEKLVVEQVSNQVLGLWNWSSSLVQGESESGSIFSNPVPNLKILALRIPKLKILSLQLLKNIHTLTLSHLSWKYVFGADLFIKGNEQLQLLESLEIGNCENMEVIIEDERLVGDGEERVYSLPRLAHLGLRSLNITKFASKPDSEIHFPSLKGIEFQSCNNMESFWSGSFRAPKLEYVRLLECDNIQCFLPGNRTEVSEVPSLEKVVIMQCPGMLSFLSVPLIAPKLRHVTLKDCYTMKWFLHGDPNNNDIVKLPSLEIVQIIRCNEMQSFSSEGSFRAPYVRLLECDNIQCFLPGNRTEVPELPSLEKVVIVQCPGMLSFSSVPLIGPKLRHVTLEDCSTMKWFLHGDPNNNDIVKLPSLEIAEITRCNEMQSFSSGGIEAPTLKKLK